MFSDNYGVRLATSWHITSKIYPNASAKRIGQELIQRVKALQDMLMMGRPVSSAPDLEVIRDMLFGNYTVRYAIHAQTLAILKVWHHYEDQR